MAVLVVQSMVDLLLISEVVGRIIGASVLLLLLLASFNIFLVAGLDGWDLRWVDALRILLLMYLVVTTALHFLHIF